MRNAAEEYEQLALDSLAEGVRHAFRRRPLYVSLAQVYATLAVAAAMEDLDDVMGSETEEEGGWGPGEFVDSPINPEQLHYVPGSAVLCIRAERYPDHGGVYHVLGGPGPGMGTCTQCHEPLGFDDYAVTQSEFYEMETGPAEELRLNPEL